MKRLIYITILSILLPLGCSKPSLAPAPAPELYDRYIFFSSGIETKAQLIESQNGSDMGAFGVVGFKYDFGTDWATYSTTTVDGQLPTPNVFYEESPDTQTYELTDVETVSMDGTTANYAPLQGWANTKKYTFFAYYPIGNSAVTLVNTTGSEYQGGVPAIKYTMNPSDLKGSMVDVMTALAHTDKFWKSSADNNIANGDVKFAFTHRLSALGLKISNLSGGAITLNTIKFTLSDIKYHEATFSLTDGRTLSTTAATPATPEVSLAFAEGENSLADSKTTEFSDKLLFIPQPDDDLSITVYINYTRQESGSYTGYTGEFTTQTLTTQLAEGQKYLISIKFTDSTVEVKENMDAGAWTDIPPVNSSFK